ncbi:MAG: hypothetical protein WCJ59_00630 [bacterium]
MIYFLYGEDIMQSLKKTKQVILTLQKKKPEAVFIKIGSDDWSVPKMEEGMGGQGLFEQSCLVFLDRIGKNKEAKEFLTERYKELVESPNFFVLLEEKLDEKLVEKIEKVAWKTEKFFEKPHALTKEERLAEIGEKIDFFEYADIFGSGDKKKMWTMYRAAVDLGVPAEEIHSIFFWQVRSMLAATLAGNEKDSGLKSYPYQKAKSSARNYGEEKLRQLAFDLVKAFHEAHRGQVDLYNALEKIILEL